MKSYNLKKYIIILNFKTKTWEVNPLKQQNFLSDKRNQKNQELTTDSKNGFSFKVKPTLQLNLLSDIKNTEDVPFQQKCKWSEFHQAKEL